MDPSSANCSEDNHSRKELGGRWLRKNNVKKWHSDERKEKAVVLSTKRSKTTKKNSWVDKDLTNKQKKLKKLKRTELYRML